MPRGCWSSTDVSVRFSVLKPGLDRAIELDRHRVAEAVARFAGGNADPSFGDAIFLDIGAHPVLEADADTAFQNLHVEMGAVGIDGKPIRRSVGSGRGAGSVCVGHEEKRLIAARALINSALY